MTNIEAIYLSGKKLYGDDFNLDQIEEWYKDEKEGYAELGANNTTTYQYVYHALNYQHAFKHIKKKQFNHVLGLGSAYGDEFLAIMPKINQITILEPSDTFMQDRVHGVPCKYIKPSIDGTMPFEDSSFDLITCIGVLHHIPNVTTVVKEIYRCLTNDGYALVREPIVSMGDWSKPRQRLTKRERGIPVEIFRNIIKDTGFKVQRESFCCFPIIPIIYKLIRKSAYNSDLATWADARLSSLLKWNVRYHPTKVIHKFRPTSIYFLLTKE